MNNNPKSGKKLNHGYGNALVLDLATWRNKIPEGSLVPGCVGPLVFGKARGFIVYIWDRDPPVGERRHDYIVPKRLPDYNKIPRVSDYDPREREIAQGYLHGLGREEEPALVAAYVSLHRVVSANRHELHPPCMIDIDDAETYCRFHDLQSAARPRTAKIADEEAALKAGFRVKKRYKSAFCAEQVYVTSACDSEVYAHLGDHMWTKVAATHYDVRSPETVAALHALGIASLSFKRWALARDVSRHGTYSGSSGIVRRVTDALGVADGAMTPPSMAWDMWGVEVGADYVVE